MGVCTVLTCIFIAEDKHIWTSGTSFDERGWVWYDGRLNTLLPVEDNNKNCMAFKINEEQPFSHPCHHHQTFACVAHKKWTGQILSNNLYLSHLKGYHCTNHFGLSKRESSPNISLLTYGFPLHPSIRSGIATSKVCYFY